jgi:hypothetical protein
VQHTPHCHPCIIIIIIIIIITSPRQTLAYQKILGGLAVGGLLTGDVDDMIAAEVGGVFMPHGAREAEGGMV